MYGSQLSATQLCLRVCNHEQCTASQLSVWKTCENMPLQDIPGTERRISLTSVALANCWRSSSSVSSNSCSDGSGGGGDGGGGGNSSSAAAAAATTTTTTTTTVDAAAATTTMD